MSGTAVLHLMRRSEGLEPFEAFMDSYERHEAGVEHELVLLLKGFESPGDLAPVRDRLRGRPARELSLPDPGPDIEAYLIAARALPHDRLCFLNAWTVLTSPNWLGLLSAALDDPRAGVVGATGSWASPRSFALWSLGLPSAYRGALSARDLSRAAMPQSRPEQVQPVWRHRLQTLRDAPGKILTHPGFPAPHLRSNGFLIERELLLSLRVGRMRTKTHAHRFECGRRSMSVQLAARGLTPLVVGCDGQAIAPEQWPEAAIFCQDEQRNLLMEDNATRAYERATPAGRELLARLSWGERARPG